MKKTLLLIVLGLSLTAQAQNCANPVSATAFQTAFNQIAVQQISQNKLSRAVEFVNANCLMAAQVKNIAQLFTEENYRLEFCKAAYTRTYDRVNFYEVYDAFATYSNVLRLHDYIHGTAPADVLAPVPAVVPIPAVMPAAPKEVVFPKYAYPVSANYVGNKGCDGPVADAESFKALAQHVSTQPTDESKQIAVQNAANENCLDMAQLMKLASTIKSEAVRMNAMTTSFSVVYDQDHHAFAAVLFPTPAMKTQWAKFATEQLTPAPPPCNVPDSDFRSALDAVSAKHFTDDRLGVIDLLVKDKCFSTEQIRTLSKTAPFGEEKIDMFKKLYHRCTDKGNYYKLVDELKFSHEQQELSEFIKKN